MWQAKLYYKDNKFYIYILQTVNTTNKVEMLRQKKHKILNGSKAIKTKQNCQWNNWIVETETENK